MNNIKKYIFTISISVGLIIAVSVYIYKDLNYSVTSVNEKIEENSGILLDPNQKASGYEVSVEEINEKAVQTETLEGKAPNLDLPAINYSHLEDAVFKIASQNIAILSSDLKKDPQDNLKWLNLAILRKMLGDYKVSVEILNFVAILWPNDYVAYNNLADLYQYYIKNPALAEKNWLKVIELKPDYIESYQSLFTLYLEGYIGKYQPLSILLKGFSQNPHSTDIIINIARYYKKAGDNDSAIIYYKKAIEEAKALKDAPLESSLRTELAEISG